MDSFFLPLVATALAEFGDKTQIVALLLLARFGKPMPIIAALVIAAAANSALGAFAGALLAPTLNETAIRLLLAIALAFAGVTAFLPPEELEPKMLRFGAFPAALVTFSLAEFGDKTQFVTVTFGANISGWPVVAAGAATGIVVAALPAIMFGKALHKHGATILARRIAGALLLIASIVVSINALGLI